MKKEKLLKKAMTAPQNIRFNEFRLLLEHYGFQYKNTKGSHLIYKHPEYKKMQTIQEKNGMAKPYQVKQFLAILEENNVI